MELTIEKGIKNGKRFSYWSVNGGQLFEGGIYRDEEWSAIIGKEISIKQDSRKKVLVTYKKQSEYFNFDKVFLFTIRTEDEIKEHLGKIRTEILEWIGRKDKSELLVIEFKD